MIGTSVYDYKGQGDDYSKKRKLSMSVGKYKINWPEDEYIEYKEQLKSSEGFDVYRFPNSIYYGLIVPDRYLFPLGCYLKVVTFIANKALQDYNLRLDCEPTSYTLSKIVMANYAFRGSEIDFYVTFEAVRHNSQFEYDSIQSVTEAERDVLESLHTDLDNTVYPETFQAKGYYGVKGAVTVCFCRPKPIQPPSTSHFKGLWDDPYAEMCKPSLEFDDIPDNANPSGMDGVITPVKNPSLSFFQGLSELSVDYFNKIRNTDCNFFKFLKANKRHDSSDEKTYFIKFMVVHAYAGFRTLEAMVGWGRVNRVPYVKMCRVKPIEPIWMHDQVPKVYTIISPWDGNLDSL